MADPALEPAASLYDEDFALWAERQARALAEGRARDLDWDHLAEEVEGLVSSTRKEIRSRLSVLIHHLLKWHFQPDQRKYGWRSTIIEQRSAIRATVEDSPSLKTYPETVLSRAYRLGVLDAVKETGMHEQDFPETCPYTLDQIMDGAFFPGPTEPDVR